jgi:hypothetical protein
MSERSLARICGHPEGGDASGTHSSNDDTLAGQVEKQNARLQALIDAVDQLVDASRALLARLQGIAQQEPPRPDQQL